MTRLPAPEQWVLSTMDEMETAEMIETYIEQRHADERFIDTVRRIGIEPFKERVYATTD